jgi:hypothetical protein
MMAPVLRSSLRISAGSCLFFKVLGAILEFPSGECLLVSFLEDENDCENNEVQRTVGKIQKDRPPLAYERPPLAHEHQTSMAVIALSVQHKTIATLSFILKRRMPMRKPAITASEEPTHATAVPGTPTSNKTETMIGTPLVPPNTN